MSKCRMDGLGIAKAAVAVAVVLSVPCCLHASTILLRNTVSNDTRTPQLLPGSASLLAATATMRIAEARGRPQPEASFGETNALAVFAASPTAFGTAQSLRVSIEIVPSTTPGWDAQTVVVALFQAAATSLAVRPASTSLARYDMIDGTVRMEMHEDVINTERDFRRRFGSSDDNSGLGSPEPSTFALLGFGLLFLMARVVRGRRS